MIFQGSLSALSVQTVQNNKTFDNYKSNVSVLQVSPQDSSPSIEAPPPSRQGDGKMREKAGRPILGAGARLKENFNRRDMNKETTDGQQNNITGNSGMANKKKGNKSGPRNKSWEHDDRFENDYN